jgi:hypothetical protein
MGAPNGLFASRIVVAVHACWSRVPELWTFGKTMTPPLQQLEEPIEKRIASALIEATPGSWERARLEVEANDEAGVLRMPHTISSPDGQREIVAATEEICAATFELRELFKQHGRAWRRLVFDIMQQEGSWHYVAHFDY